MQIGEFLLSVAREKVFVMESFAELEWWQAINKRFITY